MIKKNKIKEEIKKIDSLNLIETHSYIRSCIDIYVRVYFYALKNRDKFNEAQMSVH